MDEQTWDKAMTMKITRQLIFGIVLLLSTAGIHADEPGVQLVPLDAWTTTFGNRGTKLRYEVKSDAAFEGVLRWRHAFGNRTLGSGESAVRVAAGQTTTVSVPLRIGPINEGVVLETQFTANLSKTGAREPAVQESRAITIYSENAYYRRTTWLKELDIQVYDPPGKTVEQLQSAGVPFSRIQNAALLDDVSAGLLIVGEGVSLRQQRGLPELLQKIVARGVPILCLAPKAGEIAFPSADTEPKPQSVSLSDASVIRKVDKRLDHRQWQTVSEITASRFNIQTRRGQVFLEIADDSAGWPWLEIESANKSRLIYCGFALIEHWDAGPTPRYLLLRLIERLAGDSQSQRPAEK